MNAAVEVALSPSSPAARAANDPAPTEASASPPPRSKRALMFALLALAVLAAGGGYGAYWKAVGSRYVKTDDAYTAAEVALVTAQVDGPVARVNVVDSQQVKRGEVLVVIDDTDARLALRQVQADLARANAQVDLGHGRPRAQQHRLAAPPGTRRLGLGVGGRADPCRSTAQAMRMRR